MLALVSGAHLPSLYFIIGAMLLGSISYGLSIALFILSMRFIGAARSSAWFGMAPFAGVIISLLIFRSFPEITFLLSLPLMILGTILLFGEEHTHTHIHVHGTITHEHIHSHKAGQEHEHE